MAFQCIMRNIWNKHSRGTMVIVLDASIPQLEDVREGNVVLLHFSLVVSGQGRFYPLMLASGTSDSEPFQGEYPHSHMWSASLLKLRHLPLFLSPLEEDGSWMAMQNSNRRCLPVVLPQTTFWKEFAVTAKKGRGSAKPWNAAAWELACHVFLHVVCAVDTVRME